MSGPRVDPDQRGVLVAAMIVTGTVLVSSFAWSFSSLVEVARWANAPLWLSWAVPVTIDGAIVVYTVALLVARRRGESTRRATWALTLWTIVSVLANAAHGWSALPEGYREAVGTGLAALAPIAALLSLHTLADLVVATPESLARTAEPTVSHEDVPAGQEPVPAVPEPVHSGETEFALATVPVPMARVSRSSLGEATRDEIVSRYAEPGATARSVAEAMGVSKSTVSRIIKQQQEVGA